MQMKRKSIMAGKKQQTEKYPLQQLGLKKTVLNKIKVKLSRNFSHKKDMFAKGCTVREAC